jgi:alkylhydroperoxidase family enzyme
MSRIPAVNSEEAPEASQPLLESLEQLGRVSNFLRTVANSPAALEAYLGLSSSLDKGSLPPQTGRRIALAIAEFNSSDYSLSSSVYLARRFAKLGDCEITANRNGSSNDPKAEAAVRFALAVARERGHISREQFDALIAAGYDHAQAVEIVHHVALAILANYVNEVAGTEIDFPLVHARKPAAPGKP